MFIAKIQDDLRGWYWDDKEKCLVNPNIGRIQMVAVLDDAGNERYQQPVWMEMRGEINVVVDDRGLIAFVEQIRHAIVFPEAYAETWGEWKPAQGESQLLIPHPADLPSGVPQLEIPRGFTGALLQQAEEETGRRVDPTPVAALGMGHLNMNTAFMGTSPFLYVCRAYPEPSDVPPDPNEPIKRVDWLSPEETKMLNTLDATSYAALYLFRRWALEQKDDFWHGIGLSL